VSRPERIPGEEFPSSMSWDERAIRQALYMAWLRSANEFRYALLIAADWFADNNHPDEVVCRSEWATTRNRVHNPGGWWKWRVKPPEPTGWDVRKAVWKSPSHNAHLWLCWPRGWVRFTGGYLLRDGYTPAHIGPKGEYFADNQHLVTVPDAWCVSVQPRQTEYGNAASGRHGRQEWTKLFYPPESLWVEKKAVAVGPTLFDEAGGGE
jgi:hypothetical protein